MQKGYLSLNQVCTDLKIKRINHQPFTYLVVSRKWIQSQDLLCSWNVANRFYLLQNTGMGLWYYLSTILDDYSRFIIHWELCKTMKTEDVQWMVDRALKTTDLPPRDCRPNLPADNGACYIATELKEFLNNDKMKLIHGKRNHPHKQGKVERYHRLLKNVVKLHKYYCPEELESSLSSFVHYYNYQRYHESLNNVKLADVFYGRGDEILKHRKNKSGNITKKKTELSDAKNCIMTLLHRPIKLKTIFKSRNAL